MATSDPYQAESTSTATSSSVSSPSSNLADNANQQWPLIVPRLIQACGSSKYLRHHDYFWSGNTLETLSFSDRQGWRATMQYLQAPEPYPDHPKEHLPKTTLRDIIDIFRIYRPSLFRLDHDKLSSGDVLGPARCDRGPYRISIQEKKEERNQRVVEGGRQLSRGAL